MLDRLIPLSESNYELDVFFVYILSNFFQIEAV